MQFVFIIFSILGFIADDSTSGIYIIQPENKRTRCSNELRMLIGKLKVCVSPRPLLDKTSMTHVSDIKYDGFYKVHYLELDITPKAGNILLQTRRSLPSSKFALAIEGQVICTFILKEDYQIKSLRLGDDVTLHDLEKIQGRLRETIH